MPIDLKTDFQHLLNKVQDPSISLVIQDLLTGELQEQICGISMLIDLNGSKMDETQYRNYFNTYRISVKNDFVKCQLDNSYLPEDICCDNTEDHKYVRFMTRNKFYEDFGINYSKKLMIDEEKITKKWGWLGNIVSSNKKCIWITPMEDFRINLEKSKKENPTWPDDPNFIANLAWDMCGLWRYYDYLTPEDDLMQEIVRVEYPSNFCEKVKTYQPNATVGYFTPLSFYLSADGSKLANFGKTFCPYNVSMSVRERVHKNFHFCDNFTVTSLGKVHHNIYLDKSNDDEKKAQMQIILEEAINRLKAIA
ncbi:MAG TPA: hypothetical protein VL098_04245 [Flavipsychrobacter sp.]|nr:hypothetical protein [Flavipsychrobacter sp.]